MPQLKVCTVSYRERQHGLQIYSAQLNKLIGASNSKVSLTPAYFAANGNSFFVVKKGKRVAFHADDFDVLHLHYDTDSQFLPWQSQPKALFFKHIAFTLYLISLNIPIVITIHGLVDGIFLSKLASFVIKFCFIFLLLQNPQITFIAHSENLTHQLQRLFFWRKQIFVTIPHLIYPELVEKKSAQKPIQKNQKILVTLGFIGRWKGQLELLQIVKKLSETHQNFLYYIVGKSVDPVYLKECLNFIKKHKLDNSVRLKNTFISASAFKNYLQQADIYLDHHTRDEHSSSGTLAHAVASGKTILTTNTLLNKNAANAQYLVAKNPADYLAKLSELLKNPLKTKNLSKTFAAKINQQVQQEHLDLYQHLARGSSDTA